MGRNFGRAALAAWAALGASPVAAEPACADPTFTIVERNGAAEPRILTALDVAGARLAVVATGRLAFMDTRQRNADIEEAIELGKVMPGYPQPAYVTFDLKMSF
jgi:hypothetical protein